MKLDYELVEDSFDDTTHIRSMTEQASAWNGGYLLRTTVYTPHHISINVTFITGNGSHDEGFDPVVP
jgi:hypothetical protein